MPKPELIRGTILAITEQPYPAGTNPTSGEDYPAGVKRRVWLQKDETAEPQSVVITDEQADTLKALKAAGKPATIVAHTWDRKTRKGSTYQETKAATVEAA